jgi:glycosyltransferase involved in cell wall biosynthesis
MVPFLTVIIPAYNSEKTLAEALESIAAQQGLGGESCSLSGCSVVGWGASVPASRDGEKAGFGVQGSGTGNNQQPNNEQLSLSTRPSDFSLSDIEILLVDDASTDGTVRVAEEWGRAHPDWQNRLKILHNPGNLGPAASRNHGLRLAQSEWVAFLDADDVWLPSKLAIQFHCAQEQPEVALWCGGVTGVKDQKTENRRQNESQKVGRDHRASRVGEREVDNNARHSAEGREPGDKELWRARVLASRNKDGEGDRGEVLGGRMKAKIGATERPSHIPNEQLHNLTTQQRFSDQECRTYPCRALVLDDFITNNPVATSTVLVRKSAVESVGGFDGSFIGPEDYDLWLRLVVRFTMALIKLPLAEYRMQSGSLSMDDRRFLPQVFRVLDKAFGPGGVLADRPELRRKAEGSQYWNASWMAFNRGNRRLAIRYWGRAYGGYWMEGRSPKRAWWRLLIRYILGAYEKTT